jgi:dihydropteroate synthase
MGSPLWSPLYSSGPLRLSRAQAPLIMGIINITPDSFSDGGQILTPTQAYQRAKALLAAGADIIDVGAESTRPGARPVSASDERKQLVPALKKISRLAVPISVDTYKPEVAEAAVDNGATMINDVTGLRHPRMRQLVAERNVSVVLMHMRGMPQNMQKAPRYKNVVVDVKQELLRAARLAEREGVKHSQIILDPGIGFGKTATHNLLLLQNLRPLVTTGYPILLGPSRKSFITSVVGKQKPQERVWGTAAAIALAVSQGVRLFRVHDVPEMKQVAQVAQAITQGQVITARRTQ